jgi:hypothetical protein
MKGELLLDQRKPQYTHENLMADRRLSDPYEYKISLRMAGPKLPKALNPIVAERNTYEKRSVTVSVY